MHLDQLFLGAAKILPDLCCFTIYSLLCILILEYIIIIVQNVQNSETKLPIYNFYIVTTPLSYTRAARKFSPPINKNLFIM